MAHTPMEGYVLEHGLDVKVMKSGITEIFCGYYVLMEYLYLVGGLF